MYDGVAFSASLQGCKIQFLQSNSQCSNSQCLYALESVSLYNLSEISDLKRLSFTRDGNLHKNKSAN